MISFSIHLITLTAKPQDLVLVQALLPFYVAMHTLLYLDQ